jgi:rare lipoprotein A
MKKLISLFFLIAISCTLLAQSAVKDKDKQKATEQKDTVKKANALFALKEPASDSLFVKQKKLKLYKKGAHASYYADKFNGRRTTSGSKFSNNKYTAAHKKLPFGTMVKVTNEVNGKSVIVEITDRGPFVKSREIDLTKRAFMEIVKNDSRGSMKVTIELLKD